MTEFCSVFIVKFSDEAQPDLYTKFHENLWRRFRDRDHIQELFV